MVSGRAMRSTSRGSWTMYSPLSENMTRMVNSRKTSVSGLMRGMNTVSYHSRPFRRMPISRLSMPAMKGMPR